MPKLERTYQVSSKYTRPYKRAKTINAALIRSTPELKEKFFRVNGTIAINSLSVTALTIDQGPGSDQRIGDRIRLMSIDVIGLPCGSNAYVTASLVCPKNAVAPALGEFTAGAGNYYDGQRGWTLKNWIPQGTTNSSCRPGDFSHSFKLGMCVDFVPGNPAFIKNGVYFCVPNSTATAVSGQDCMVRVRFYDA